MLRNQQQLFLFYFKSIYINDLSSISRIHGLFKAEPGVRYYSSLRRMTLAAEAGATIFPVIPAFYFQPASTDEIAREYVNRVLAHVGLPQPAAYQWKAE